MRPLVSTVIATYNHERFIREAVDSALAQTGVETECIVVDDGSTDDTASVLANYGSKIRVVKTENGGPSRARNLGAEAARGEWLAFLDSDDRWAPDKLEKQIEAADGSSFVYTDRRSVGDVLPGREFLSSITTLHDGDVFEPLLLDNFITTSSVMIRRTEFERLGGFYPKLQGSEDWDMWLRYAASEPVRVVPKPLTVYRRHAAGISKDAQRMIGTHLRVLQRAFRLPRAHTVSEKTVRHARALAYEQTAEWMAPYDRCRAIRYYLRTLRLWPTRRVAMKGIVKCLLDLHPGDPALRPL